MRPTNPPIALLTHPHVVCVCVCVCVTVFVCVYVTRASRGGWVFDSPEPVFGGRDLREVYDSGSPGYTGRCTAPLLVDTKAR